MTNEDMKTASPSDVPKQELFSVEEIYEMALHQTLRRMGIKDPVEYLQANKVTSLATFKAKCGVAITVLKMEPKSETTKA